MATIKKITTEKAGQHVAAKAVKKSYANDPYVVKKVEQAKAFIEKTGLPNPRK